MIEIYAHSYSEGVDMDVYRETSAHSHCFPKHMGRTRERSIIIFQGTNFYARGFSSLRAVGAISEGIW